MIDRSLYGQEHVRRYRETDGEVGYIWNGAPTLLLTTTGRRTGEPATTPLIFGRDGDNYVIVASQGGAPEHPGWYAPRQAARGRAAGAGRRFRGGPDRRGRGAGRALAADGRDLAALRHATRTDREIPVVVVERLDPERDVPAESRQTPNRGHPISVTITW